MKYFVFTLITFSISASAVEIPPEKFAALAYSRSTGRFGKAVSENTSWMAKDTAIRSCYERDCEVKLEVKRGCIAIAQGYENPGPSHVSNYPGLLWYGFGSVQLKVEEPFTSELQLSKRLQEVRNQSGVLAITACEQATQNRCQVFETFCTWNVGTSSQDQIREWIAELGGESAEGIRNVYLTFSRATATYLIRELKLTSDQAHCVSGQYFSTLLRVASQCGIGVNQLDAIYGKVNR